ncbi:hypothetical protein [Henriciella aquimarina]|uniref:hypothetical protein n=1 Tax=Henriciella aquimarina TaxID=545261 RepID=UPI0009FC984B|nr:hypothetical protein [Henriciella aquimarina]
MSQASPSPSSAGLDASLLKRLDSAIRRLDNTSDKLKLRQQQPLLQQVERVLLSPGGVGACLERIVAMDKAGVFAGTDWDHPAHLKAGLVRRTLESADGSALVLEALSELRFLAIARGQYEHAEIAADHARHFLSQVLGLNLEWLFGTETEVSRRLSGDWAAALKSLFETIAEDIGYGHIFDAVISEIWRILAQRPIQTDRIKAMVAELSVWSKAGSIEPSSSGWGADRLTSALFAPTNECREDPGAEAYAAKLPTLDDNALTQEAAGMARAMHDTGLVSAYHAVLLRYLMNDRPDLVAECLGLTATGRENYMAYRSLIHALMDKAIHVETAQAIYGLALLLERGLLHLPPTVPALWRQCTLKLAPAARQRLVETFGPAPEPEAHLLAGVISVLGQPLGVGQGNNPTCQAARAIAMWAYTDPDYLLQLVAWAARDNEVHMPFEGTTISSGALWAGLAQGALLDVDPVSAILVPHLDRIYMEMGRMCAGREGDPHRWINPEMHGWWVARGFDIVVDVPTGQLVDIDGFVRRFYAAFHPDYNGNQPVIHPSPAGIAVTDSAARFVGWHAIAIIRVARDPSGDVRVYFFNPNNDSGQDWGDGVIVSTAGNGEFYGESSVPIADFASRLYIFHCDPMEQGPEDAVDGADIDKVRNQIVSSWGRDRTG